MSDVDGVGFNTINQICFQDLPDLKAHGLNGEKQTHAGTDVVQCLVVTHFTLNDYPRKTL